MRLIEIIEKNRTLLDKIKYNKEYTISILSNIIINRLKDYLEFQLRSEGINCKIKLGDYDNIIQDSSKYRNSDLVIIFWETSNLIDGLNYKIELMKDIQFNKLLLQVSSNIDLVFKFLKNTPLVLINKFTHLPFINSSLRKSKLETFSDQLNEYIVSKKQTNTKLIEIEDVLVKVGLENSLDLRYYYSSKALYTNKFYEAYSEIIKPFILAIEGKSKKALIFDCDNTLWKGILGEDGFENIEMSSKTKDGAIFAEVQSLALELHNQGIIIGLCSKNNFTDIESVLNSHPDIILKEEHLAIIKINWKNKVINLHEISKELNIGLDSIVFVDDSPFEINLIREQLPEITVLQVPERLFNYPKLLRENLGLFYKSASTDEDKNKTLMFKQQAKREKYKNKYSNIEEYLISLEIKIKVYIDDNSLISRMSQMTQKTNQFNLTTFRYTEADIKNFVITDSYNVFAISVSDKFGDSGVTGLCILKIDRYNKAAKIDTFLLSCRILGRNIEFVFLDYIINYLKENKINTIYANYFKTLKNEQVEEFYENNSFIITGKSLESKDYKLEVNSYIKTKYKYISIING